MAEAIMMFEDLLRLCATKLGPDHPDTLNIRNNLAMAYERTEQYARAETLLRGNFERARAKFGANDLRTAGAMASLGLNLLHQTEFAEAEPLLRACLAIRERWLADDWTRFNAQSLLGGALLGQRRFVEAEPLLVEGYNGLKARADKMAPQNRHNLAEAARRIVRLYCVLGQSHKATALLRAEDRDAVMPNGAAAFAH
jgi:hypothetical protein